MMEGFPESIRREQLAAACEALGLPAKYVSQLTLDVHEGLSAVVALPGPDGRRLRHAGEYVTTVLQIPINDSPRE